MTTEEQEELVKQFQKADFNKRYIEDNNWRIPPKYYLSNGEKTIMVNKILYDMAGENDESRGTV